MKRGIRGRILPVAFVLVLLCALVGGTLRMAMVYAQGEDTGTVSVTVSPEIISLTVVDKVVAYGNVALGDTRSTLELDPVDTQTVTNTGSGNISIEVKCSDATGGISWELVASSDTERPDEFAHQWSADNGISWNDFDPGHGYATLNPNVAPLETQTLDLKIHMPTSASDHGQKSITITVLALGAEGGVECTDVDMDTFTTCEGDCDDNNAAVNPGATEVCNGIDDNCDGNIDEGFDNDQDGYTTCEGDCDDYRPYVYPGAPEFCDGLDNDCDEQVDENCTCNAGYANCDNNPSNGCEVDLNNDPSNCGSCGYSCQVGYACVAGICPTSCISSSECAPGFQCSDNSCVAISACSPDTVNTIKDGSFEGGPGSGNWTEYSTNFGTPICDTSTCGASPPGPRTGSYWVWLGGTKNEETAWVSQTVVIPTGASLLAFWFSIPACAMQGNGYIQVTIDSTTVFSTTTTDPLCGVPIYTEHYIDITSYADGASHTITFYSYTIGLGLDDDVTNFFVDDVRITC